MYGLQTLARLNREAAEAQRIMVEKLNPAPKPDHHIELPPVAERLATMNRLLDAAKG
jgi:hypothetical protein